MTDFIGDHDAILHLPEMGGLRACRHVVEPRTVLALNTALATGRPLLLRGEPGTGKSQLARAAAFLTRRALVHHAVDGHTDTRDLLYTVDAVARLARAQVLGARGGVEAAQAEKELALGNFVQPGPVWWALSWKKAKDQSARVGGSACEAHTFEGCDPSRGVVLLIDEIDKADQAVPNGLLDALGHGSFDVPGCDRVATGAHAPLVLVTTNETRALPDAFLRRCLVMQLALPEGREALLSWLVARGQAQRLTTDAVLMRAAELTATERASVKARGLSPPGQAEYLDLVRAVAKLRKTEADQLALLEQIAGFALKKHPEEAGL